MIFNKMSFIEGPASRDMFPLIYLDQTQFPPLPPLSQHHHDHIHPLHFHIHSYTPPDLVPLCCLWVTLQYDQFNRGTRFAMLLCQAEAGFLVIIFNI